MVWKDKKEFSRDLKDIYGAPARQAALWPWTVKSRNGVANILTCDKYVITFAGNTGMATCFQVAIVRRSTYPVGHAGFVGVALELANEINPNATQL